MVNLEPQSGPQTYIIAQNPAVLAQLMRENENRTLNPSAYTTPASVFNTIAVDIDSERVEPVVQDTPALPLKTVMLPASEILKLDPIVDRAASAASQPHGVVFDVEDNESATSRSSTFDRYKMPQDAFAAAHDMTAAAQPPPFPVPCEIINALSQQMQSLDPNAAMSGMQEEHSFYPSLSHSQIGAQLIYSNTFHTQQPQSMQYIPTQPHTNLLQKVAGSCTTNRPPHSDAVQKSRSLERNTPPLVAYSARISSLERLQNAAKQSRSNSLTRQFGSGDSGIGLPPTYAMVSRSASLERGSNAAVYSNRTKSLERQQQTQLQAMPAHFEQLPNEALRGGSLERNQSAANTYEMSKQRALRSGSLDRNQPAVQYQMYRDQFKQTASDSAPLQEEIYDFGGANVKSCASIALNKSISKGLIPPGTTLSTQHAAMLQQKQQQQPRTKMVDEADGLPPMPQQSHMYYPPPKPNNGAYNAQHVAHPFQQGVFNPANSTYTPMYPRMWAGSQQQIHAPQPNLVMSQALPMQQSPKYAQNASASPVPPIQIPPQPTATTAAAAGHNNAPNVAMQMQAQPKPLMSQQSAAAADTTSNGATAQVRRIHLQIICLHRHVSLFCCCLIVFVTRLLGVVCVDFCFS